MKQLKEAIYSFYSIQRLIIFSLMMSMCATAAFAQFTVKGKVLDEFGETIIGANIVEKGTTNGTITDMEGNYTLSISNSQRTVLQFSFIGYNTKEETVNGRNSIDVTLDPSVVNLGEVVAIGYGTQTRREITGSVANITEESFNKGVTRDAADLLQGKVAGLMINMGTGDVGGEPTIRLRGTSTIQKDKGPFIVIDGVPGGDMSTVSPQDIESISVLKDASSAAIYGSRSAGGVILITTKRGSGSKTQVSYDGYVAMSNIAKKPDLLTADEWREYVRKTEQDGSVYDQYGADTDWVDEITRTAISHNHAVSMSGGGSKNNYRASFTYLNREGVLRDNAMERYNFRFQFQQRAINDRLRIGLTGSTTLTDRDNFRGGNFVLAYNMLPVYPVKLADGSWFDTREYDQGNPVRNQDYNKDHFKNQYFFGNGDISFTIIDGLDVKANLYKSRHTEERSRYENSQTQAGRDNNGWAERRNRIWDKELMELTANYNTAFGGQEEHKLDVMGGYSWERNDYTHVQVANRDFVTDMLASDNLQAGQGLRPKDVESARNMNKLISFFGRAHYSYKERYMITATLRRDGSSKFGANHKWGTFPSASAAWGISQEDFMQDINWVSDLKLRVGYGVTGNQDGLDPYKSLELYGSDGTYYDNNAWLTAYKIKQNANADLKWEETSMLNVGLDFTLFNGRLNGTIEWYDKQTKDMLYEYNVPTPPYLHNKMMANVGDMKNTGLELAFTVDAVRTKDFNWTTSLNMAYNKNEITRLSNDIYTADRILIGDAWIRGGSANTTHVLETGYPLGQFYGWKCLGLDAEGHYIMQDMTGEGQISEEDRTYIGSAYPDVTFGWNNTFSYKNWDMSIFLRGSIGNDVLNHMRMAYAQPGYLIGANALNDPLIYQLKQVPEYSSYYIEDASFARLDNMSIGYTFNTKKLDWLDRARVYVTAQNLFVITGYSGLDPEVDFSRSDGSAPGVQDREFYPKNRTFSVGVSLSF
ncbi:TonB-linked SusC/RagA family outer membrane protein [Parabacteroides sp. PF5-5]|uniref:SusC/RagA family TonB-linked outer membrane protein n=2 Tax=Parabacteroides TaxID=375288 RepID=UPI0024763A8E|nr:MULTISPECIES: TonB-dependent receptor [unclassified Parabacteroides]MDH6304703.1 TonB-linked SusC/RagA family outer membrane protein [Parabacteroides sp. PH5-39]MDH6315682.1 TonB-linked SusC/RagA family outer membrane protein [Parabacteroides sp. PF5-13]MDH6319343.1 TonB-linked SusC/RagA family outer membrane protein [Parabacteroides sp. PH5-13]MDH6323074.1 TonB-linked SusC/RagA family outer membrane protein [Parabacteroides sp. PH5-8]MDH6326875.1 TonB-linked SusC/RagA family outer membrane